MWVFLPWTGHQGSGALQKQLGQATADLAQHWPALSRLDWKSSEVTPHQHFLVSLMDVGGEAIGFPFVQ